MKFQKMRTQTLMLGLAAFVSSNAMAANHKTDRKIARACAMAHGISLPTGGAQMSAADQDTIHACIKQFRTNLYNCAKSAGISNPRQPASDQVPAYRQCETQAINQIK